MTEAAANAAAKGGEEAAETIIELVEHIPPAYLFAAMLLGAAIMFGVMMAVSKPTATPDA